ncbi:hypothetical protein Prum_063760 [Phytohabitans rumicis]|uniref:Uncharacterized protein n=1 Tax=Phytohabitans rumicis TaxID=1076125 RepID=A0A6V8L8W3_9ACTN|nr:hypothetical protein Prum_063760 [Phytohabitans rumicis]
MQGERCRVDGEQATVHPIFGAGDERRPVAGEERDYLGDLFGLCHPAKRVAAAPLRDGLFHSGAATEQVGGPAEHGCVHGAGADGVDPDPFGRVVQGHRPDQRVDRGLARGVRGDALLGDERLHRGDGDDGAAAPRAQVRDRCPAGEEDALEVDVEDLVPQRLGRLDDRAVPLYAGARDKHVDAAEAFDGGGHEPVHVGRDGYIGVDLSGIVKSTGDDRGASVGQPGDHRGTDALRPAGHHGDLARELRHGSTSTAHVSSFDEDGGRDSAVPLATASGRPLVG